MKINELLAKLLLGFDINEEWKKIDDEKNSIIEKEKTTNNEVGELTHELESLKKLCETLEFDYSKLEDELKILEQIDVLELNKILEEKTHYLKLSNEELQSLEKSNTELNSEFVEISEEIKNIKKENDELLEELKRVEKEIRTTDKEKEVKVQSLFQLKKIRDNLFEIKEQWNEKLYYFRNALDQKQDLNHLKLELEDYEEIINNHLNVIQEL